jgi:hypothetical protein
MKRGVIGTLIPRRRLLTPKDSGRRNTTSEGYKYAANVGTPLVGIGALRGTIAVLFGLLTLFIPGVTLISLLC